MSHSKRVLLAFKITYFSILFLFFYFEMNQLHYVKDSYSSIAANFLLSRYCKVFSNAISWHAETELTRYTMVDITLNSKIRKISIQVDLEYFWASDYFFSVIWRLFNYFILKLNELWNSNIEMIHPKRTETSIFNSSNILHIFFVLNNLPDWTSICK